MTRSSNALAGYLNRIKDSPVFAAGATSAVGNLLVPMLVAAGHEVAGTSRSPAGVERIKSLGATGIQADALDAERLRHAVTSGFPALAKALGVPTPAPVTGRQEWERGALNALAPSLGWQTEAPTWRTGFAAQRDIP